MEFGVFERKASIGRTSIRRMQIVDRVLDDASYYGVEHASPVLMTRSRNLKQVAAEGIRLVGS